METLERRVNEGVLEFRSADESAGNVLSGYAVALNTLSRGLGGWFEEIAPEAVGAATEEGRLDLSLHGRILGRTNHDNNLLLGTTDTGTLRLFVDEKGLRYELDLPNTSYGKDLAVLAERGDIRFSSFAFRVLPDGVQWREDTDGRLVRRIVAMTMVDVAPVADPAYFSSSAEMQRSFDLDAVRASLNPPDSQSADTGSTSRRARANKGRALSREKGSR